MRSAGIEPVELLQSSISTRQTAGLLARVLQMLAQPALTVRLVELFKDIYQAQLNEPETRDLYRAAQPIDQAAVG